MHIQTLKAPLVLLIPEYLHRLNPQIELNPFCAVGETRYKFRMELSINTIKIVLLAIGSGCFYT
jgi:hypothetical protein